MREMKDSGIEWIGKIPHCWNTSKLKYLGQYINGYAFKPEEWGSKGVPIIRIQDLTGSNDNPNYFEGQIDKKYGVENGDILISWAATLDAFIWNKGNGWLNQHIFKAVPNRRIIDYDFFFWMIKESMKNMNNDNKHGIFMQHVTLSVFNNFTIPMPPLAEQHRIAAFLDRKCAEIDAVLEKTRASIEEYKKLKQAVITQAVTKGIRGDRPMKNSGIEWIGEIPAEWDVVRQKYFWNTVESGVSVNAADKPVDNSEQYGVLKTSAVSKFVFIPTEHKQVNLEEYGRVSCPVRADSIIASRMNTPELVGACGYVQNNYPNLFLPDRLWQITFKDGLSPKYAWYYLSGIRVRQYISSLSTGTSSSMQNISQSQYGNIFITIPSIGEQSEITKYLDEKCRSVDALIAKKQQYLTEIENYKKSLIYEYVTGKKEV